MTGAGPSTTPTSSGSPGSRPRVHQHAGGRHVARHIGVVLASTPAPTGTITTTPRHSAAPTPVSTPITGTGPTGHEL
jgi:hypothetical protein